MVLHVARRLLLQLLASVLSSREILDFGQQLSVCVDCIIQGKATEIEYRMAGKFGGEFILADWRFESNLPIFHPPKNFTV